MPGDQVARNDEKYVDTHVAARDAGRPHMVSDVKEDGDGAQSLDVGAKVGYII